tara:strand:- start:125 stop:364 length:240 start_codon:yes stop_codon:yes gene_type:complete
LLRCRPGADARLRLARFAQEGEGMMARMTGLGLCVAIGTGVMVALYHFLAPVQEWVIFGAIAGVAMALGYNRPASGGTP